MRFHPSNMKDIKKDLALAKSHKILMVFEWLVDVIGRAENIEIGLE